ncbi:MAG: hypothetical protein RLZZ554_196, partial [Actinomycetota bacterium]
FVGDFGVGYRLEVAASGNGTRRTGNYEPERA